MSCPHPLSVFRGHIKASGAPSRDFYLNFCSACRCTDSCHFWTLKSFFYLLIYQTVRYSL